jgi:hypothetical protein
MSQLARKYLYISWISMQGRPRAREPRPCNSALDKFLSIESNNLFDSVYFGVNN